VQAQLFYLDTLAGGRAKLTARDGHKAELCREIAAALTHRINAAIPDHRLRNEWTANKPGPYRRKSPSELLPELSP
jgi:hypothetical protein